jgi:hypothetical protein
VHLIGVDGEVDALDDLGAVLECDVQILQLEQSQLVTPSSKEFPRSSRWLVTGPV